MTEPKTVDEIMRLVKQFAYLEAKYETNESPYPSDMNKLNKALVDVQEAITALAAERDQAVENVHSMTTATREFQADFNRIVGEYRTINRERDALAAERDSERLMRRQAQEDFGAALKAAEAERDQALKDRDAAFEMGQRYGEAGTKSIDGLVNERDALEIKCEELTEECNALKAQLEGL